MAVYIIVSIISGILFGFLDGLINATPFAQKLYEVFKPISKQTINIPAGFVIDLVYGFAMAGIFLILYDGLPGDTGVVKGISFALMAWFFRVVMSVVSQWMMFKVPAKALLYALTSGLVEMLALGLIYGLALKP